MGALEVGDRAPEVNLPGIRMADGRFEHDTYSLSGRRGRPVVTARVTAVPPSRGPGGTPVAVASPGERND